MGTFYDTDAGDFVESDINDLLFHQATPIPHTSIWYGLKAGSMDYRHSSVTETSFDTQAMLEFFKQHPVDSKVRFSKTYNLKNGQDRILDWVLERLENPNLFQVYEKNRRIQGFYGIY